MGALVGGRHSSEEHRGRGLARRQGVDWLFLEVGRVGDLSLVRVGYLIVHYTNGRGVTLVSIPCNAIEFKN